MASANTSPQSPLSIKLPPRPVLIALFSIYVIWGATNLGNRIALESYPPFLLAALRLLLAVTILMGFLKIRGDEFPSMNRVLNAVLIGGLMFGAQSGLVAFARQQGLGLGMLSLGVATVPLWAMIFSFGFGYRPSLLEVIGLLVGMVGMVFLNVGNDFESQPIAIFILLLAPMIWAFASMYTKQIKMPKGFMGTGFQMMGGCAVLFVMSLLSGEQFPTNPSINATVALIFLSVLGTLVAFSAYMYLVQVVSPGLATSYSYVNPVVGAVFGFFLLDNPISSTAILSIIVIGAGIALVMMGKSNLFLTNDEAIEN